ncbi:acyl-CoA dehydrogenase family protein [Microbacterium aurantiacum]|uniref:acyl-CoA dehydrogenase family protein n=1 Tax=Microbacterium aurantiacum TaxID=162393 RepID=UPI0031E06074
MSAVDAGAVDVSIPEASAHDRLRDELPDDVVDRFARLLEGIRDGSADRDRDRVLPFEALRALRDAGLPVARLPRDRGGLGLDWPQFGRLLIEVAAADPNLPQILRGHVALVEQTLTTDDAAFRERWLGRIGAGQISGNAWSEPSGSTHARAGTELVEDDAGALRVHGRKFYTTGSLFAEWTDVVAHRVSDATDVAVLVRLDQPSVTVSDDWDGIGQRLTGTGTIVFDGASVDAQDAVPVAARFPYQTALYQFVLLAVLAGIARTAVEDAAAAVRARTRSYSHGSAARTADDPQILGLLGEQSAVAFAVQRTVVAVADDLERAYRAARAAAQAPSEATRAEALAAAGLAEIRTAQAQSFATRAVQQLTSRIFDALGASATARGTGLDRHWRNARTVSSHNPVLFKDRWIGEYEVHDRLPQPLWAVGTPVENA